MARKREVYWLSDVGWRAIQPHLPTGRCEARRVDDLRVLSGIMHILRSAGRWKDCPAVYGPQTTIYNRWNRWSRQGVWQEIFYAVTGSTGVFAGSVDSTHIKAHRTAAGTNGGLVIMPLAPRAAAERGKSTRRPAMRAALSPLSSLPAMPTISTEPEPCSLSVVRRGASRRIAPMTPGPCATGSPTAGRRP